MDNCSICLLDIDNNGIKLNCNHIFHSSCIKKLLKFNCPICREKININKIFNIDYLVCEEVSEIHQNAGYSPHTQNGSCRYCYGYKLK